MAIEDYLTLITSEHVDRPRFLATVDLSVSPFVAMQDLLRSIPEAYDIDHAVGVQLDAVGLWIGRTRKVYIPVVGVFFEWDGATVATGWDVGLWLGTGEPSDVVTVLTDDQFRQVLRGKIEANKWKGDREGQYRIIDTSFGKSGTTRIVDNQDMTQTILVNLGALSSLQRGMLESGYIPIKPAGVGQNFEEYFVPPFEFWWYWSDTLPNDADIWLATVADRVILDSSDWLSATAWTVFDAETTIQIAVNGTPIGSATFGAGGTAPVSATTALLADEFTMAAGDVLSLIGGSVADVTGSNIALTIFGTRIPT